MWSLYIIQNKITHKYYVGVTKNIQRRLKEHQGNFKKKWTQRQPGEWGFECLKKFNNKTDALREEKKIKRQKSRRYIERFIKENQTGSSISQV